MEAIPPTVYARLAVPEHILQVLTKIHARHGQIVPSASTSLPTAQAAPTVAVHLATLENIPLTQMHSLALRGPVV